MGSSCRTQACPPAHCRRPTTQTNMLRERAWIPPVEARRLFLSFFQFGACANARLYRTEKNAQEAAKQQGHNARSSAVPACVGARPRLPLRDARDISAFARVLRRRAMPARLVWMLVPPRASK